MLKSLRNRMKRDTEPRILILGLDNAGKTTILNKMGPMDHPANEGPTQGFNVKTLSLQNRTAKLCDLGGQRSLRDYWQDYYDNTDCLMYVVDSSDQRRLEEAHATFVGVVERMPKVPILVLANKQDLGTARSPEEVAQVLQLTEYKDRKWQIQGCSAKTGRGLEEGVEWILHCCC